MPGLQRNERLAPEQRQDLGGQLAAGYRRGRSIAGLAAEVGTSPGRVRALLLEQGVALRARGGSAGRTRTGRRELAEAVAREYREGASLAELGQRHGRSASSARTLVLDGGGTLRSRGGRRSRRERSPAGVDPQQGGRVR